MLQVQNAVTHEERLTGLDSFEPKRTLTPLQSIRRKCLDCSCGSRTEVKECVVTDCPLWNYRMGRRPKVG